MIFLTGLVVTVRLPQPTVHIVLPGSAVPNEGDTTLSRVLPEGTPLQGQPRESTTPRVSSSARVDIAESAIRESRRAILLADRLIKESGTKPPLDVEEVLVPPGCLQTSSGTTVLTLTPESVTPRLTVQNSPLADDTSVPLRAVKTGWLEATPCSVAVCPPVREVPRPETTGDTDDVSGIIAPIKG